MCKDNMCACVCACVCVCLEEESYSDGQQARGRRPLHSVNGGAASAVFRSPCSERGTNRLILSLATLPLSTWCSSPRKSTSTAQCRAKRPRARSLQASTMVSRKGREKERKRERERERKTKRKRSVERERESKGQERRGRRGIGMH